MAVWHVVIHLVPRRALASAPARLTPAVLARTDWWAEDPFPKDYRERLEGAGTPAATGQEGLESWGTAEGSRVDVTSAAGRVRRVTAFVDVRLLDARFGAALLTVARAADALLVRGDGLVVDITIAAYAAALRTSAAWREGGGAGSALGGLPGGVEGDDDAG